MKITPNHSINLLLDKNQSPSREFSANRAISSFEVPSREELNNPNLTYFPKVNPQLFLRIQESYPAGSISAPAIKPDLANDQVSFKSMPPSAVAVPALLKAQQNQTQHQISNIIFFSEFYAQGSPLAQLTKGSFKMELFFTEQGTFNTSNEASKLNEFLQKPSNLKIDQFIHQMLQRRQSNLE